MKTRDGKFCIETSEKTFEVQQLDARDDDEKEMQRMKGPRYRIVASLSMIEEANKEEAALRKKHGGKCTIEKVLSRKDIENVFKGALGVEPLSDGPTE